MGWSLREINIEMPWLKIVVAMVVAIAAGIGAQLAMKEGAQKEVAIVGESQERGDGEASREEIEAVQRKEQEKEAEKRALELKQEEAEKARKAEEEARKKAQEEEAKARAQTPRSDIQGKKLVALSFDDGPSPGTTPRLLEVLRAKNVAVSFFVLGNMVEKNPGILRQQIDEGHEVGSHTVTHANLARSTIEGIRWEEARMDEIFRETVQRTPELTRPPYGEINDAVRQNVGRPLMLWSVDPEDWKYKDINEVVRRVESAVFDGAVVLMHDIYPSTVEAVGRIIDDLRAQGYEFLTISQLAKARGVTLEKGWSYGSFRP